MACSWVCPHAHSTEAQTSASPVFLHSGPVIRRLKGPPVPLPFCLSRLRLTASQLTTLYGLPHYWRESLNFSLGPRKGPRILGSHLRLTLAIPLAGSPYPQHNTVLCATSTVPLTVPVVRVCVAPILHPDPLPAHSPCPTFTW